jgi:hypothetical protein
MSEKLPEKVVQIEVLRINRSIGKRCKCLKANYVVDPSNREVTCSKCGARVDAFDAIYDMAHNYERFQNDLNRLHEQYKEIASYKPWLVVIKNLESNYRGHKMIPHCPRCNEPFYLEEISGWMGKDYADARIKRWKEEHPRDES